MKKWPAFSRSFNLLKLRLDKTDWQASDEIAWDTPAATVNIPSRKVAVTIHRKPLMMRSIDLKGTPDGEYYCFEVNPSPGFLYYEQYTGQPISTALADVLHHGSG